MSDPASDDYPAFDLSKLTDQDYARIDAAVQKTESMRNNSGIHQLDTGTSNLPDLTDQNYAHIDNQQQISRISNKAHPAIAIHLEDEAHGNHGASLGMGNKSSISSCSPLQRHRPNGILSVTDLTSPAWCEVQFEYGLQGRRSRPVERRPESFTSSSGKTIRTEKTIAIKNDQITKKGKAVHKELERELGYEVLKVDITTDEERWALRFVNMMACLNGMLADGFTREMPVFGVIHNEVVVGIVDEISLQQIESPLPASSKRKTESPEQRSSSKRTRTAMPSEQTTLDQFLPSPKSAFLDKQELTPAAKYRVLHIIDTKTRRSNSLPPHEDTLSSRLQLMSYFRLLSDLISLSHPFNFSSFWERLHLDSSKTFSTKFLQQARLISDAKHRITCLDDLSEAWLDLVKKLDVAGVDTTLQLIYRSQPKSNIKRTDKTTSITRSEALDLAKAIAASLLSSNELGVESKLNSSPLTSTDVVSDRPALSPAINAEDEDDLDLQLALLQSASVPPRSGYTVPDEGSSHRRTNMTYDDADGIEHHILGSKNFDYDAQFLDSHLTKIMKWWHGERKPEGVPVELVRRCRTCEYYNDCEWREQRALEFIEARERTMIDTSDNRQNSIPRIH